MLQMDKKCNCVTDLKIRFIPFFLIWMERRSIYYWLQPILLLFRIREESLRVIVNSERECVSRDFSFAQQTSRRICNRIGLLEIDKFGPSLDRYLWNIVICKFAPLNATESLINPDSYITIELIELLSYLCSKFQKRVICLMLESFDISFIWNSIYHR